jgi:hypothetical protein
MATMRENIPVTAEEQSMLELMLQDTLQRQALIDLVGEPGTSRAAVAHSVLSLGIDAVRTRVQEIGYVELAESYTAEELHEQRLEAQTRNMRSAERWAQD